VAAPPSAAAPVRAEVGRLQDKTRTPQQEDAGRAEAFVDEGHWALRTRLGNGLRDKGLRFVSESQLYQYNLVCNLHRCG
jgi:hypothetical protein